MGRCLRDAVPRLFAGNSWLLDDPVINFSRDLVNIVRIAIALVELGSDEAIF